MQSAGIAARAPALPSAAPRRRSQRPSRATQLFVCSRHAAPHQSVRANSPVEPAEYRLTLAPFTPVICLSLFVLASAIYKAWRGGQPPAGADAPATAPQQLANRGSSSVRPTEATATASPNRYDDNAVVDIESRVLGAGAGGGGGPAAEAPAAEANIGRLVICAQLPQQQSDEKQLQRLYGSALEAFRQAVPASKQPTGFILVYPR